MARARSHAQQVCSGVAVALLLTGACSRTSDEPNPFPQPTILNTGATCDDPVGDLSKDALATGGNLAEPAGIDIVRAEARLVESVLRVSFTTAGPIAAAPDPEFRVNQGEPGHENAFELRAAPASGGAGPWTLSLVTFGKDNVGRITERPPVILSTPLKVEGTTLSYEVAQQAIPRVATFVWLFGATSGSEDVVIDACDNSAQITAQTSVGGTTQPATTTTLAPRGKLGDPLTYQTGSVVTVFAPIEAPPSSLAPGATPAPAGSKLVVVDARVCAPDNRSVDSRRSYFFVKDTDDRNYASDTAAAPARVPPFPDVANLPPGECVRGYVTATMPENATPQAVIYSPDPDGTGVLLWNVN